MFPEFHANWLLSLNRSWSYLDTNVGYWLMTSPRPSPSPKFLNVKVLNLMGHHPTLKLLELLRSIWDQSPKYPLVSGRCLKSRWRERERSQGSSPLGCCLFLKSEINFMGMKSCVLFTELGRTVVESVVFYMGKSTPRHTHSRGKMMNWEVFFKILIILQ